MSRRLETNLNGLMAVVVTLLLAVSAGCQSQEDTDYGNFSDYGKIHGQSAGYASVDGLSGLITLFRSEGCVVRRAPRISPLIDRFDTILWCPNRSLPPSDEVIDRLERWLAEGNYRSIIFVAPGFRGKRSLLEQQLALVPDTDREKEKAIRRYNEHLSKQRFDRHQDRYLLSFAPSGAVADECKWFTQKTRLDEKINNINGQWDNVVSIKEAALRTGTLSLDIKSDLDPVQPNHNEYYFGQHSYQRDSESLLEHTDGVLLSRIFCPDNDRLGQIFIFSNGSALMNLGLANPQNRKIAGELIDRTVGPVMLLESGPSEIEVRNSYAPNESGWEWLTREPIGNIVPFFLLLSVVAFFCVFPIHGRARRIDLETKKTFRDHIDATGRLLNSDSNRNWAVEAIRRYKNRSGEK